MTKVDYGCTDDIDKYLKKTLNARRYAHSIGVAEMATTLADIYGVDKEKAYFTGLCHDIAKCYTIEQMNRLIREYGVPIEYFNNQALAHSKVGMAIMRDDFSVSDEEVLNAIGYHTTGRYGMSLLEEIIYVSDAIDRTRNYKGVRRLRQLAKFDIHEACLEIAEFCINNILFKGGILDRDTIGAKRFALEKVNENNN